jgi:arginine N-succinyltransferase
MSLAVRLATPADAAAQAGLQPRNALPLAAGAVRPGDGDALTWIAWRDDLPVGAIAWVPPQAEPVRSTFRVGTVVHASRELKLLNAVTVLTLGHDCHLAGELSAPWLVDAADGDAAQVLFEAALAHAHAAGTTRVLCKLAGVRDARGESPFWAALGSKFCTLDPLLPAARGARTHAAAVARLMPRQPVYASFLGDAANCVGMPHRGHAAWQRRLESQGFAYRDQVDFCDAGPVLERLL